MTRWYIQSMYTAAKMMPVVATTASQPVDLERAEQDQELADEPVQPGQPERGQAHDQEEHAKAGMASRCRRTPR